MLDDAGEHVLLQVVFRKEPGCAKMQKLFKVHNINHINDAHSFAQRRCGVSVVLLRVGAGSSIFSVSECIIIMCNFTNMFKLQRCKNLDVHEHAADRRAHALRELLGNFLGR